MNLPSYNQVLATAALVMFGLTAWTLIDRVGRQDPGKAEALEPANAVQNTDKVAEAPPKIIYVYPKSVKSDLGLPATITADDRQKVTATGKLKAEDRDYTLSAVLDTETGQSQVFSRPEPLPWFGPGRQGAIGLAYGLKNGGATTRLYAHHDIVQVKALHAGPVGTIDQDGDWFAGIYAEWRF